MIIFTALGVALLLWVMSQEPHDLAPVRWVFYPFAGSLAALIIYIVVYLVQLTRADQREISHPDGLASHKARNAAGPSPRSRHLACLPHLAEPAVRVEAEPVGDGHHHQVKVSIRFAGSACSPGWLAVLLRGRSSTQAAL
jgi:hypothetical protein